MTITTFALITEGQTDQAVLDNILHGFFEEEIEVHHIQPPEDATDHSRWDGHASWTLVKKYCELEEFGNAAQYNDYVVIQIDSDVCEKSGFDVPKTENGREVPTEELVEKIGIKIIEWIGEDIYNTFKNKIIFAICVHSLECWLLPIFFENNSPKSTRTKNCLDHLNRELRRQNLTAIPQESKDYRVYDRLSGKFSRKKHLEKLHSKNPSLKIFVESLQSLPPIESEQDPTEETGE